MKPAANKTKLGLTVAASGSKESKISFAIFPKINGTTIKNENLAAFSRSIPNNTQVEIVAPEREMPGRIATA